MRLCGVGMDDNVPQLYAVAFPLWGRGGVSHQYFGTEPPLTPRLEKIRTKPVDFRIKPDTIIIYAILLLKSQRRLSVTQTTEQQ